MARLLQAKNQETGQGLFHYQIAAQASWTGDALIRISVLYIDKWLFERTGLSWVGTIAVVPLVLVNIFVQLQSVFLAGYETSANALAFTIHCLSHHPEVGR